MQRKTGCASQILLRAVVFGKGQTIADYITTVLLKQTNK